MPTYTPHTPDEIESMLEFIGLGSLGELFDVVPEALRLPHDLAMAPGIPEPDAVAHLRALASRNLECGPELVCFAGGGAYDREVPPVTTALASRSEFVTSYTPYQPEVAQGVLQALFEFQTMVARLAGLEISNASLYDGASALVEAVNLGVSASGRSEVWVSRGVHPSWREVLKTFARGTGHVIVEVDLDQGQTRWPDTGRPGVVVMAYPNHLGCLEDVGVARELADSTGAILVMAFDPIATSVLRSPGSWGADVAVGEGQALGMPLSFGGPYLGLFACRQEHVRRLPGRLVGESVDTDGRTAYVTTLRAREQDIRRQKATSNVCTNQTLMAVTAAIQLGWLGTSGIAEVAKRSALGASYCRDLLVGIDGVEPLTSAPTLMEFSLRLPIDASTLIDRLVDEGFLAGIPLDTEYTGAEYTGSDMRGLLVTVTEKRTRSEIDAFAAAFARALR